MGKPFVLICTSVFVFKSFMQLIVVHVVLFYQIEFMTMFLSYLLRYIRQI